MSLQEKFTIKENGIILRLRILPNSSKNMILKDNDDIKLKITAQPIEGKANKAVVENLSKLFKVPKSAIEIVKGDTSKDKTIFIKTNNIEKIDFIKQILEI